MTVAAVQAAVRRARGDGHVVGFVPTMGALHDGHVRLIKRCREETGFVIVSIFVNPTQFGPGEDLTRYPRTFDDDLAQCRDAGAGLVFAPTPEVIYPAGPASTFVEVPGLSDVLEGASRPGHFRGVATVVLKFFEIVRPDVSVFGQKDYQQQLVIRRMVADLHVPVRIVTEPTVREPDGLAMSSRNRYLDADQRQSAVALYRALTSARRAVLDGETSADRVRQILRETIESSEGVRLDYAEVADGKTLEPLDRLGPGIRAVALVAARLGSTRLIDNLTLEE